MNFCMVFLFLNQKKTHIGNIKLGPINFDHLTSEISYFIGEKISKIKVWKPSNKECAYYCKKRFKLKKITAECIIIIFHQKKFY